MPFGIMAIWHNAVWHNTMNSLLNKNMHNPFYAKLPLCQMAVMPNRHYAKWRYAKWHYTKWGRSQFAYQSNKSTVTALHELVTKIETTLDRKEIALVAFLDIEGAFDNASYSSIDNSMVNRDFDPCIKWWIMEMLSNRKVSTELGESSITVKTTRGCPQGGVLSPLLWSLVVDDLLNTLEEKGYEVIGFAR